MYTQKEIKNKIMELQIKSPAGTGYLLNGLISAIDEYFTRDEEFEKLIRRTLMYVTSDVFSRGIEVEYPERLPPLRTDYPIGYEDVTEIFGGEVFEEIMEIEAEVFINAYESETQTNSSGGVLVTYSNPYITRWIDILSNLSGGETEALETIGEFCISCNEERGLALIFEELGEIRQKWTDKKRELAKLCYVERGYDWVISNFGLEIFEPHYMDSIR